MSDYEIDRNKAMLQLIKDYCQSGTIVSPEAFQDLFKVIENLQSQIIGLETSIKVERGMRNNLASFVSNIANLNNLKTEREDKQDVQK